MPSLIFVGTSSGYVSSNRNPSCLVYSADDMNILLDCGDGATRSLIQNDIDPNSLDATVITHMHPDHSSGLMFFIQTLHLMERKRDFFLYVPSETLRFIPHSLNHHYLFKETLGFNLRISPIPSGESFLMGDVSIHARPNRHLTIHSEVMPDHRNLLGESFSLDIRCRGTRMVYTSDILDYADLVALAYGGGNLLATEIAHIEIENVKAILKKHNFSKVILTHIPPEKEGELPADENIIKACDGLIVVI